MTAKLPGRPEGRYKFRMDALFHKNQKIDISSRADFVAFCRQMVYKGIGRESHIWKGIGE
jgi:hypothetical protein